MQESAYVRKNRWNQRGFTLIELMAVLAILAIILAIAVPSIGKLLDKAGESADDSAIELIEDAGEKAFVDKQPFDTIGPDLAPGEKPADGESYPVPEKDSYSVPTLVDKGYLKLDPDSKFYAPGEYVTKKNKGGEFVYKGKAGNGSDDGATPGGDTGATPGAGTVADALACEEAKSQGYTCIYTPDEFNAIRDNVSGKYILMNDISLADYANWMPIGTRTTPFMGELNGNGNKITNLTFTSHQVDGDYHSAPLDKYDNNIYRSQGLFGIVAAGNIQNVTLEAVMMDIDYLQPVDNYPNVYDYTSFLVGYLSSTATNNPENKPFSLTNVAVSGDMTVKHRNFEGNPVDAVYRENFGSLIGQIHTVSDVVIDGVFTDVNASSTGVVSGAIGYTYLVGGEQSLTVNDVQVNGLLDGNYAMGLSDYLDVNSEKATVVLTNIELNADVIGRGMQGAYGAVYYLDTNYAGYADVLVQNLSVNGSVTSPNGVYGAFGWINLKHGTSLLENIQVAGKLTLDSTNWNWADMYEGSYGYEGKVFGFADQISFRNNEGEHTLRNIDVSSAMDGMNVYGFANSLDMWGAAGTMPVRFSDISLTGQITSGHNYYGFSAGPEMDSSAPLVLKNINISNVVREGSKPSPVGVSATEFVGNPDGVTIEGVTIESDIQVSGSVNKYE